MLDNYPRPSVSTDVVVFSVVNDRLSILLIERRHPPYQGMWALPGGFVNLDESLEDAARRELEEETGVKNPFLEQLYTYGDPDRDPRGRVITVSYFALISPDMAAKSTAGSDAASIKWHDIDQLPELAFDHKDIITYAVTRLRYKFEHSTVGFELLPDEFTLTDVQKLYEIVLDEELDKRNFRRRILSAKIIEPTLEKRIGEGRPAQLYRYRQNASAEIKSKRLFP